MKLNCAMLIWLGKQRLGHADKGSLEVIGKDSESPVTTIIRLPDNGRDTPVGILAAQKAAKIPRLDDDEEA